MMPVLFVILESGAIYSFTLITLLATYLAGSWAQYLLLDSVRRTFLPSAIFADSRQVSSIIVRLTL